MLFCRVVIKCFKNMIINYMILGLDILSNNEERDGFFNKIEIKWN